MTTNATVEARHKDIAWAIYKSGSPVSDTAQLIANLGASRAENADLNNRLAEIDRIANAEMTAQSWSGSTLPRIAALASGHTPSPCPGCAAKDEAMAEIASECGKPGWGAQQLADAILTIVKPFIPPADPVAEALNSAIDVFRDELGKGGRPSEARTAALAELKSRLEGAKWSRLGGAK